MPSIPYPEFNDFHLELNRKVVRGTEPVEGYALLSMNSDPNCVKDILIALRCCFRYRTDDGTTHTVLLHEEIQRNATPFDDCGVPEGDYEFPFSFTIPPQLPPSVIITGGWDTLNNCKIWYEIRAYVMHAENHSTLERKHLRTSVKFQRCVSYNPQAELMPQVAQKKEVSFNHVDVRVELDKEVHVHGEPVRINLTIKNELLRNVSAVKLYCKQVITIRKRSMRQVKEFIIKHTVGSAEAKGNGIPVKRHQVYQGHVLVLPQYSQEETGATYGGIALSGCLDPPAQPDSATQLCPSITRHTPEGIDVSYSVEIHLCVMLASDMIISVPFILSDEPPEEQQPPSYWNQSPLTSLNTVIEPLVEAEEGEEGDEAELPSYDETMRRASIYRPKPLDTNKKQVEERVETQSALIPEKITAPSVLISEPAEEPLTADGKHRKPIRMSMNRQMGGQGTDQLNHASLNMDKIDNLKKNAAPTEENVPLSPSDANPLAPRGSSGEGEEE
eukprot:Ihof_evm7s70 gene=Ihof_evmTU7s70